MKVYVVTRHAFNGCESNPIQSYLFDTEKKALNLFKTLLEELEVDEEEKAESLECWNYDSYTESIFVERKDVL